MSDPYCNDPADVTRRRVFYYTAGFLRQKRVRRILSLAGYDLCLGTPGPEDLIAVWGRTGYARRGEAMAKRTGASLLRVEDAFLRSLHPGRSKEPPLGLVIDQRGIYFDASAPSDLEHILATHPLDDTALLDRARGAMARIAETHLTKYSAVDPTAPCPAPGYVLVVDQTRGDASVSFGGADANSFREMLYYAQEENPGARILIKTHPETQAGHRPGYFGPEDETDRISLFTEQVSPRALMEGAIAVYCVTSQLGFEAIFCGHRPKVFGQPFYAGWGLSDDRHPLTLPRRGRRLTRAQLFAGAMMLYPTWYDPYRDALCDASVAIEALAAQARSWREDHRGWVGHGMRLWKRAPLQKVFGQHRRMVFRTSPRTDPARRTMVWAAKSELSPDAVRVEDGFLRSRGLGAELVPPLSLVCDQRGIYYDPTRPSDLETHIAQRSSLRLDQRDRIEQIIQRLSQSNLSKYNLGGLNPELPEGYRILVPGQVEDDASIRLGAGDIATNRALLARVRGEHPDAVILFKPHPDVEAGLRPGAIAPADLLGLADMVLAQTDPMAALAAVDEVWTMTSLLGFEALLRGVKVTTTGAPFYAGWGLTHDLGRIPARRIARPDLAGLAHAALIDYPRYFDPVSGLPCPVEVVMERLEQGEIPHPGPVNRIVSKLQGVFASQSWLWR